MIQSEQKSYYLKSFNHCEKPITLISSILSKPSSNPANKYMLKFINRNTKKRCEIRSKLTINTQDHRHGRCTGVFIVNFEHIPQLS